MCVGKPAAEEFANHYRQNYVPMGTDRNASFTLCTPRKNGCVMGAIGLITHYYLQSNDKQHVL